jgi:hypothetical protein
MKSYKIFIIVAALVGALGVSAGSARAQGVATPVETVAPIVVGPVIAAVTKPHHVNGNWLRAEVVHFDSNSIVVREQGNDMAIHTFTYTPELQGKMQALAGRGGYQYGDRVKILLESTQTGQLVALKIHGKPSKPL